MNSTKKYIQENKYVLSLPRIRDESGMHRRNTSISLFGRLYYHLYTLLLCLKHYPKDIWLGRNYLAKTWRIKNSKNTKKVLVIGNGPSQGYLDKEILKRFVMSGGETICVNFWNLNDTLSAHIPTWLVLSDPQTFRLVQEKTKSDSLIEYLKAHPQIKLVVPCGWARDVKKKGIKNEVFIFVDTELSVWKNINPILPRGYVSMTLYKALAWSIYLNYAGIGIIGMDNTYPRNIYSDKNNRVLTHDVHNGLEDTVHDFTEVHNNVAGVLDHLLLVFHHLEYFPSEKIVNLDQYSLTDRFRKIEVNEFFTQN
jgi:hypothetical protein